MNCSFLAIDGHRYFLITDDAFISMRYAWNLSHGLGFVWNPGERVEGITNFLMALVMSLFTAVFEKRVAVLAVQISNIVFLLIISHFFMRTAEVAIKRRRVCNRNTLLVLAVAAPLTYYPLVYWSLHGMETPLLGALFSAAVYCSLNAKEKFSPALAVLLGLAFLTRPDAAIGISVILAFRSFQLIRGRVAQALLREMVIIGLFITGITLFRLLYFGSLFPNTYALRLTGMTLHDRIAGGVGYITPFLHSTLPIYVLCLLIAVISVRLDYLLFAALPTMAVLYQISIGGDAFCHWRHLALYLPYLYLIIIIELDHLLAHLRLVWLPNRFSPKIRRAISSLLLVTGSVVIFAFPNKGLYAEIAQVGVGAVDNNFQVNHAILLNHALKRTASIAVTYAGIVPYFTSLKAIDILGKCDKYIASLPADVSGAIVGPGMKSAPAHNKYDLYYSIVERRPTFTATDSWGRQNVRDFIKQNYVQAAPKGFGPNACCFAFLKNSPDVHWERVYLP